jgi:hypothetical protein
MFVPAPLNGRIISQEAAICKKTGQLRKRAPRYSSRRSRAMVSGAEPS